MSNRNLSILGLAAVLMVIWAVAQSRISGRPYEATKTGGYLIQGLDPDQIAGITIGRPDEQVILSRRGKNFVVANKDNYPAIAGEINKLISTCLDIQTSELYTDNPANHKDLGVTEADATVLVKFFKADSSGSTPDNSVRGQAGAPQSMLTGVVIGRPRSEARSGVGYVRRADDNKVYSTAAQIPWIKKRATDYIDMGLTRVKREDINSVTVSCPNETYVLRPARLGEGTSPATEGMEVPSRSRAGGDENTIVLDNLPEGKKLKNDTANGVFTALANLRFEDVNAESSRQDLKFDGRYICRLNDSTAYTFWLAKSGDEWLVKCDAQFVDKTPVTKTQGEVESEEQLKAKEAKLLARDAAEDFSEKHKGWVYQIPAYIAENLTKPLAELVEDLKATDKQGKPDTGAAADENDPPADE